MLVMTVTGPALLDRIPLSESEFQEPVKYLGDFVNTFVWSSLLIEGVKTEPLVFNIFSTQH